MRRRAEQHRNRLGRVLILSASAGAGHMRAAEAIERAFQNMDAAIEVRHLDVLQLTNKLFRRLYSQAYLDLSIARRNCSGGSTIISTGRGSMIANV
jgi:NAD(P)-dependent dehydrogenase (short-subunit alcohol dehydrogenase family)